MTPEQPIPDNAETLQMAEVEEGVLESAMEKDAQIGLNIQKLPMTEDELAELTYYSDENDYELKKKLITQSRIAIDQQQRITTLESDLKASMEKQKDFDLLKTKSMKLKFEENRVKELEDHLDLMNDEFQRIAACSDVSEEIKGLCERAQSNIKHHVHLIDQRDGLRAAIDMLEKDNGIYVVSPITQVQLTLSRIEDQRQHLEELTALHATSCEALKFYADPINYEERPEFGNPLTDQYVIPVMCDVGEKARTALTPHGEANTNVSKDGGSNG